MEGGRDPSPAPSAIGSLRVALVHDYLNQQGGAERVLEVFVEMFPVAPLFTAVYDAERMPAGWRDVDIRTSFMQRVARRSSISKALLPLYPTAFESFDLGSYDLVLSSATTFAKGVITRPETCHVCYCANPTRFLWMYHRYLEHQRLPLGARGVLPWIATALRQWDFAAAQRVDYFVAGSHNAARRIAKYYRRESDVLQPPIDLARFAISAHVEEYFLVVSRLQPYKRIDIAVEACNRLRIPLHVVGDGPDRDRLAAMAGPTVRMLGRLSDVEVSRQMQRCRALIFPGEEDFGLAPLEAQASGRPVIAYGAGGALETVRPGTTGELFPEQTVQCLVETLEAFRGHYEPEELRAWAATFDKSAFKRRLFELLADRYAEHVRGSA